MPRKKLLNGKDIVPVRGRTLYPFKTIRVPLRFNVPAYWSIIFEKLLPRTRGVFSFQESFHNELASKNN